MGHFLETEPSTRNEPDISKSIVIGEIWKLAIVARGYIPDRVVGTFLRAALLATLGTTGIGIGEALASETDGTYGINEVISGEVIEKIPGPPTEPESDQETRFLEEFYSLLKKSNGRPLALNVSLTGQVSRIEESNRDEVLQQTAHLVDLNSLERQEFSDDVKIAAQLSPILQVLQVEGKVEAADVYAVGSYLLIHHSASDTFSLFDFDNNEGELGPDFIRASRGRLEAIANAFPASQGESLTYYAQWMEAAEMSDADVYEAFQFMASYGFGELEKDWFIDSLTSLLLRHDEADTTKVLQTLPSVWPEGFPGSWDFGPDIFQEADLIAASFNLLDFQFSREDGQILVSQALQEIEKVIGSDHSSYAAAMYVAFVDLLDSGYELDQVSQLISLIKEQSGGFPDDLRVTVMKQISSLSPFKFSHEEYLQLSKDLVEMVEILNQVYPEEAISETEWIANEFRDVLDKGDLNRQQVLEITTFILEAAEVLQEKGVIFSPADAVSYLIYQVWRGESLDGLTRDEWGTYWGFGSEASFRILKLHKQLDLPFLKTSDYEEVLLHVATSYNQALSEGRYDQADYQMIFLLNKVHEWANLRFGTDRYRPLLVDALNPEARYFVISQGMYSIEDERRYGDRIWTTTFEEVYKRMSALEKNEYWNVLQSHSEWQVDYIRVLARYGRLTEQVEQYPDRYLPIISQLLRTSPFPVYDYFFLNRALGVGLQSNRAQAYRDELISQYQTALASGNFERAGSVAFVIQQQLPIFLEGNPEANFFRSEIHLWPAMERKQLPDVSSKDELFGVLFYHKEDVAEEGPPTAPGFFEQQGFQARQLANGDSELTAEAPDGRPIRLIITTRALSEVMADQGETPSFISAQMHSYHDSEFLPQANQYDFSETVFLLGWCGSKGFLPTFFHRGYNGQVITYESEAHGYVTLEFLAKFLPYWANGERNWQNIEEKVDMDLWGYVWPTEPEQQMFAYAEEFQRTMEQVSWAEKRIPE